MSAKLWSVRTAHQSETVSGWLGGGWVFEPLVLRPFLPPVYMYMYTIGGGLSNVVAHCDIR